MEKYFQRSQLPKILLLILLLSLLVLTPFISSSIRPSYLYFLLNLLIISLGVEAGFLSAISGGPRDEKKVAVPFFAAETPPIRHAGGGEEVMYSPVEKPPPPPAAAVEKKVAVAARVQKVMKRCSSRPSLFFIGGCEGEGGIKEEKKEEEEEVVDELMSKQELFAKAEVFIGNFYKQLKMQREESWKKIHGLLS